VALSHFKGAHVQAEVLRSNLEAAESAFDELALFMDESDERVFESELCRFRGQFALARGGPKATVEATRCVKESLDIAARQSATPLHSASCRQPRHWGDGLSRPDAAASGWGYWRIVAL
jgi:hypothetical protein